MVWKPSDRHQQGRPRLTPPCLVGSLGASQVAAFCPLPEPSPTPPRSAIPPRYCSRPSLPGAQAPVQPDTAAPLTFLPLLCHSRAYSTGQRWSLYPPAGGAALGPDSGQLRELTLLHVDSCGVVVTRCWSAPSTPILLGWDGYPSPRHRVVKSGDKHPPTLVTVELTLSGVRVLCSILQCPALNRHWPCSPASHCIFLQAGPCRDVSDPTESSFLEKAWPTHPPPPAPFAGS